MRGTRGKLSVRTTRRGGVNVNCNSVTPLIYMLAKTAKLLYASQTYSAVAETFYKVCSCRSFKTFRIKETESCIKAFNRCSPVNPNIPPAEAPPRK